MNKSMIVGMVAVLAASGAMAQNNDIVVPKTPQTPSTFNSNKTEVELSADLGLFSSHVWRGQVLNNDFVFQPQLTVQQYGVSVNIAANYDLKKNYQGNSGSFSEVDFLIGYDLPIDLNGVEFEVGLINYNYTGEMAKDSTSELYGKATITTFEKEDALSIIPEFTLFGDVDEVNGVYMLFDVHAIYPVMDKLTAEAGVSIGWGNTSYNSAYWEQSADSGWNDYNFYGNLHYAIMDGLQVSLNVTYTMLEGGAITDGADANYESDNKFWSGLNLKYIF